MGRSEPSRLVGFSNNFPLERSDDLIGKTELPQEEAAEFHRE